MSPDHDPEMYLRDINEAAKAIDEARAEGGGDDAD